MLAAGVFVGVSHQTDERIDALRFAARDAEALWAALADANEASGHPPEPAVLLTNTGATTRSVGQALDRLAPLGQHRQGFPEPAVADPEPGDHLGDRIQRIPRAPASPTVLTHALWPPLAVTPVSTVST